jgi:hypothetical protein
MSDYLKILTFPLLLILSSCSSSPDAQSIITKAIEKHGGETYANSRIAFTFRDGNYAALQQGGDYIFTRQFPDSLGGLTDSLSNDGLNRTVAGEQTEISSEDSAAYANSVNSVIYFAKLPYKLNDGAVNKELIGETTISGEPYYEIRVTFAQEGGGTDYEDTYIYWFHRDDYTMDYLAYRFHVDGGGTRFREAKNMRVVNGVRFADYNNFGSPDMEHPLEEYDSYFEADTLNKVSEINLEDIEVELLDRDM